MRLATISTALCLFLAPSCASVTKTPEGHVEVDPVALQAELRSAREDLADLRSAAELPPSWDAFVVEMETCLLAVEDSLETYAGGGARMDLVQAITAALEAADRIVTKLADEDDARSIRIGIVVAKIALRRVARWA